MRLLSIEKVTFSDFMKNPSRYAAHTQAFANLRGELIDGEMHKRGWSWIVFCNGKVIAGSANIEELPNEEEIAKLGERHGFIPFAYTLKPIIEEFVLDSLRQRESVDFVGSTPPLEC